MGKKLKPKSYQKRGARFAARNAYSILAMDMGLGKSITSLLSWRKTGGRLLVVAPAYLVPIWKDEIEKWYGDEYIISCFQEGKSIYDLWDTDIAITSYDLALKAESFFAWCDRLVLDEVHNLKGMQTKRTEYFHRTIYENSIEHVTLLSGTPIQNRVEEYYSIMSICYYNPKIKSDFLKRFPDAVTFADYFSYRQEFKIEKNGKFVTIVKWKGYRRVKELKEYLKPIYFRIKFDDVEKLDPIIFKDVLISKNEDPELMKEFKRLKKLYDTDESFSANNSKRKRESSLEKAAFTIKYAQDILADVGCVVIFTDHVESCEAIAKHFGVPAITGKMSSNKRSKVVKAFQNAEYDVICATIGALATGTTLIRANNMIMNDESWVPGTNDQVYGRIRRIGQTKTCIVHRMYGSPQDKAISKINKEKRKTIAAVT